jgi:hypothetical protein
MIGKGLTMPGRRLRNAFARERLGLAVATDRVSAVLLDRRGVRWSASEPRDASVPLAESLSVLLAQLPRRRALRPVVVASVGAGGAQVKRLCTLPRDRDAAGLAAFVRERARQFFLVNGVPLYVSGVRLVTPEVGWVVAIEAPIVHDIAHACRAAKLRLASVVPAAVALEHAVVDTSCLNLVDGSLHMTLAFVDGAIAELRRVEIKSDVLEHAAMDPSHLVPALRALGDAAWPIAAAFGAARIPAGEPLAVAARVVESSEAPDQRRVQRAAIACALAGALALVAPPVVAMNRARTAHRAATLLTARARTAQRDVRALTDATAKLAAVNAFERSRESVTQLIGDFTRALPDSAALAEFDLDSAGAGSVVAYAAHAADVVDAVERVRGLTGGAIVGPVTQEIVAGRSLERVTVRFAVVPASQRPEDARAP